MELALEQNRLWTGYNNITGMHSVMLFRSGFKTTVQEAVEK